MSVSLDDGAGGPTDQQVELYRRWSTGGAALSLIGEVQVDHRFPEKPRNLVFESGIRDALLGRRVDAGAIDGAQIWPQLGHAGACSFDPISRPSGPSALYRDGLYCDALTVCEIEALPMMYASAAGRARAADSTGVEIHVGHGFLLSQFLSPLFPSIESPPAGGITAWFTMRLTHPLAVDSPPLVVCVRCSGALRKSKAEERHCSIRQSGLERE